MGDQELAYVELEFERNSLRYKSHLFAQKSQLKR